MATIDPALEPVLSALVRGLRELGVPFCVVGALVPQLLLDTKPTSRTNDADVVVFVPDVAAFDAVKKGLASNFSETPVPHRLRYAPGGLVDLLPYSHDLAPNGTLRLPPDLVLNMAGFDRVLEAAVEVRLDSGSVVPVTPLSLYALLKLVAYTDRTQQKDIEAVEHVLRFYADDDDRRWGLEHGDTLVDYDYGPAYLLGLDGAPFLDAALRRTLHPLLADLAEGSTVPPRAERDDYDWRPRREDLFHWYRLGLGL